MPTRSHRVLVVSTNERLRNVLPTLLARQPELAYEGSVATPGELLTLYGENPPDVVIAGSPPANIHEVLAWRTVREAGSRLIMLTRYIEQGIDIRSVLAGAAGLILVPEGGLPDAILRVATGETLHRPQLSGYLHALITGETLSPLTRDERRILDLVSEGQADTAIASNLSKSRECVREHIARIAEKLS